MSDIPVPTTTQEQIKSITDRRIRWPTLNLMNTEFREYLKKSTGCHKDRMMDILEETNKVQLKNISTIRQVLKDLKDSCKEAENTGDERIRRLKNKQVWELVDATTNTINECKTMKNTLFYDMEALLNMWEMELDEERVVVLDHIEED